MNMQLSIPIKEYTDNSNSGTLQFSTLDNESVCISVVDESRELVISISDLQDVIRALNVLDPEPF